jgi:hypothetical protein
MKDNLTHKHEKFGCTIYADLENTVAVLTDPDGKEHSFVADKPGAPIAKGSLAEKLERAPKNALWHACQHAKADQKARHDATPRRHDATKNTTDEPTDIDTTDVENVEGASKL